MMAGACAAMCASARGQQATQPAKPLPPVRAITRGPAFHWFGYYDKLQFDPTGRYVLGMEVGFEHRSPTPDDVVQIGMVDLKDADKWIPLGESRAWCWQQGCMLQWRPGSKSEVLWNDRQGEKYVCRVLDVFTRKMRTIPQPIYAVSPDGRTAVSADFRRIQDMRPGYGYPGLADPWKDQLAPEESGIHAVDLQTGSARLVVSIADIAKIPFPGRDLSKAKHYFNHLLVSPDGRRFEFLHRWRQPGGRSFETRMLAAAMDGSDVRIVDPSGDTSHFIWRDAGHILAWSRHEGVNGFFLYEDKTAGRVEQVGKGVMTQNGHCTYLPDSEWILNDTYPSGPRREQHVYLYHVATGTRVPLGAFASPARYTGEWRCDTHPRFSPDGRKVCIDSPHGGEGRQLYLIDIGQIVASPPPARSGVRPRNQDK